MNKRIKMNKLKVFFILLLTFYVNNIFAYSGYVGQTINIPTPSIPNGIVDGAAWYSTESNNYVSVSGNKSGGKVQILKYFKNKIKIACQFAYRYNNGSSMEYGHDTYYYEISCKPSVLTLDKSVLTLKPGEVVELSYINASGYDLPFVIWETDNENIADFYGKNMEHSKKTVCVRAVNEGVCTITCNGNTGYNNPTCIIKVEATPPKSIKLFPEMITLKEGEYGKFNYKLEPEGATTTLTWHSSNNNIVTVNSSGKVIGVNEGTAVITVKTSNGLSSQGVVNVTPVPKQVILDKSKTLTIGYSIKLEPKIYPTNASSTLKWESSNSNIVIVDSYGVVKGIKKGTATIKVSTENNKYALCQITVSEASEGMDYRNVELRMNVLENIIKKTLINLR